MLMLATTLPAGLRSRRGTASVELAIVMPVLLSMVLGISDIAMTTIAKFKSSNATATGADLATQAANLQNADMTDIFAGALNVMAPLPSAGMGVRITSVAATGNGSAIVHWSCGLGSLQPLQARAGFSKLANGDGIENALNMSNFSGGGYNYSGTDISLIQVETTYSYTPPAGFVIKTAQVMTAAYINYPRQAGYVGFPWDGVTTHPPPAPSTTTKTGSTTLSNGATCNYAY